MRSRHKNGQKNDQKNKYGINAFENTLGEFYWPILLIYLLVLVDSYTNSVFHLINVLDLENSQISYPKLLAFLQGVDLRNLVSTLIIMNIVVPALTVLYLDLRGLRILSFVLFFITKGLIFTHYQFAHYYWPLMWVLLLICIPSRWSLPKKTDNLIGASKNYENIEFLKAVYRSAILAGVSIYFFSGFWKILSLFKEGTLFDLEYGSRTVAYYLITRGKSSLLGDFAVQHPIAMQASFLLVVGLQFLAPLVIFSKNFLNFYIGFIILFHALNIWVLQVNYILAGLIPLILLAFVPNAVIYKKPN